MSGKTARLFVLSGQSNAGGNGNGELLSAEELAIDPDVLIYRSGGEGGPSGLHPMAPAVRDKPKTKFGIDRLIFGPELFFAKEIKKAYPEDIIAVAKVATRGGTSIVAWEKDHDRPGWLDELKAVENEAVLSEKGGEGRHLYNELIEGTKNALSELGKRQDVREVIISGFVWVQNENDGRQMDSALKYRRNLTNLIHNIRADLNTPDLPAIFMDVHQPEPAESRAALSRSMREVVAELRSTAIAPCEGAEKYPDNIHFNTEGMKTLGVRFAQSYLNVISSASATS